MRFDTGLQQRRSRRLPRSRTTGVARTGVRSERIGDPSVTGEAPPATADGLESMYRLAFAKQRPERLLVAVMRASSKRASRVGKPR